MDDMDEGFLKLTNHKDHPTNKAYKVFFFYDKKKAHYFETSLKERNIGVLITDHNVRETLSITDRSYLLFNGQILKSGTSEFLANDKEAKRLYLGEKFRLD